MRHIFTLLLFFSGCTALKEKYPHRHTSLEVPAGYDEKVILVYANNPNAILPPFEIFNIHSIPAGTAKEQLNALNTFQESPCLTPPCNCGRGGYGWRGNGGRLSNLPFVGAKEASKHQNRLKVITEMQTLRFGENTQ